MGAAERVPGRDVELDGVSLNLNGAPVVTSSNMADCLSHQLQPKALQRLEVREQEYSQIFLSFLILLLLSPKVDKTEMVL